MSRTTIYAAGRDGVLQPCRDFSNAWGSAWFVWTMLWRVYLCREAGTESLLEYAAVRRVWALDCDPQLTAYERITLTSTFDRCLIRRTECSMVADAFDAFSARYERRREGRACTLPAQALYLRELAAHVEVYEVGWQQTSVAAALWSTAADEPFDVLTETGHWFLFDRYPDLRQVVTA